MLTTQVLILCLALLIVPLVLTLGFLLLSKHMTARHRMERQHLYFTHLECRRKHCEKMADAQNEQWQTLLQLASPVITPLGVTLVDGICDLFARSRTDSAESARSRTDSEVA